LFYIIALTFVGLLVPYTDKQLLGASSVDITASPFVLAINNAGIKVLPSIINVVILISVMSVGNSAVYGSSRTMAALAEQGFAPKIFGYIDRAGRPLVSIIITLAIGLLCFLAGTKQQGIVFDWFMAISALCVLFTWASICFCHIRFRRALKVQGRSTDELAFTSMVGVWGSWFGVIINVLIIIAQFWIALFPIGGEPNANSFFMAYISVPLVAACFIFWKLFKRTKFLRAHEIDVMTGRRELDLDLLQQELAEEKAYIAQKNIFYRTYRFWC
jgi:amino acid transporter